MFGSVSDLMFFVCLLPLCFSFNYLSKQNTCCAGRLAYYLATRLNTNTTLPLGIGILCILTFYPNGPYMPRWRGTQPWSPTKACLLAVLQPKLSAQPLRGGQAQ